LKKSLAILLTLAATQVAAQDIGYKMDAIKPGSTITFKNFDNMVDTHVFEGKTGEHYVFKTYNGPTDAQPLQATVFVTENGEVVRVEKAGGEWITFTPHNCVRTVGTCSYVQKSNKRRPMKYNRFTEVSGNTLTFSVAFNGGKIEYTGFGQLGIHNWPDLVTVRWSHTKKEVTQKLISTDFK